MQLLLLALASSPQQLAADTSPRPFTVADSIGMTQLIDPDPSQRQFRDVEFKMSPDGSRVAFVTRRGDLATGRNMYSLWLMDVAEVRRFVNSPAESIAPRRETLITRETFSPRHAIDGMKWMADSHTLVFVGRDIDGRGRVYAVDVGTGQQRALTRASDDVATFDFNPKRQRLVYAAFATPDWRSRNEQGYAVTSEYIGDLTAIDPEAAIANEIHYFVSDLARNTIVKVDIEPGTVPKCVSLSPSGRWVVILTQPKRPPATWGEYRLFAPGVPASTDAMDAADPPTTLLPDTFGRQSRWLSRFYLVDADTGKARPLLDSPARATGMVAAALWAQDDSSVVVAPTYLPLDLTDSDSEERDRRRSVQWVAEVDIASGRVVPVTDLVDRSHAGRSISLSHLQWQTRGILSLGQREYQGDALPPRTFRKQRGVWHEARHASSTRPNLDFSVSEDMNTPPDVVAEDRTTARRRRVSELNPQLRETTLGSVEVFQWSDRLGRQFMGGLVRPPNFITGRRYPVVLQTYGFNPQEFLVDGPNGMATAFAARALVNKGILVLQMPEFPANDPPGAKGTACYENSAENPLFVVMMESAIDTLDARGFIDRARVGLIGFSRTGMHVHYAITFSEYPIAAATIADSIAATPFSYVLVHGGNPGMVQWEAESLIGAPLWGDGIKLWLQRSPAFHLDRIRTPLRYEHLNTSVPAYWDTFSLMKRHQRPIEMIHIPNATHRLETPLEKYASQQGNVDWFVYWLKNEIDDTPAKTQQYARWQELRRQHEALASRGQTDAISGTDESSTPKPHGCGSLSQTW